MTGATRNPKDPFLNISPQTRIGRAILELKDRTEELDAPPGQDKYSSKVDDLGPVLHYLLDESAAGTIADRISSRDGTLSAGTSFNNAGPMTGSESIEVDGDTDLITTPDDPALRGVFGADQSFSVEFWFNDNGVGSFPRALAEKRDSILSGLGWTLEISGGDFVQWRVEDPGGETVKSGSTSVVDSAWHHIVAVRDAANSEIRLYIDGSQEGAAVAAPGTENYESTADLTVAGDGGVRGADGLVSNFIIYDSALTGAQIQELNDAALVDLTAGDNLGNHIATQNLDMAGFDVVATEGQTLDVRTEIPGAGGSSGRVEISTANASGVTNGSGGDIDILPGNGIGFLSGGSIRIECGNGTDTGSGGTLRLGSGNGGASGGNGGQIQITGGEARAGGFPGLISLVAGRSVTGTADAASATMRGGAGSGDVASASGKSQIIGGGGAGGNPSSPGGAAEVLGGDGGNTNAAGGPANIKGGGSSGSAKGAAVNIDGGTNNSSSGGGGDIIITGGDQLGNPGFGSGDGGTVFINGGPSGGAAPSAGGGVQIAGADGTSNGAGGPGGAIALTAGS